MYCLSSCENSRRESNCDCTVNCTASSSAMTGDDLSYNELAVLRARSELFSLEEEELHPSVRPRTAIGQSIRITEYAQTGTNPQPRHQQQAGEDEAASTQFLSPTRLKALAGTDDLQQVTHLHLSINCSHSSLGNFGSHLPNLSVLHLSPSSTVPSVRDLGTSLTHLTVLSLPRCSVKDLDGLPALPNVKELHTPHNLISDVSLVSLMSKLEILNLEDNLLNDADQVGYLALCPSLSILTLCNNPICSQLNDYRDAILTAIPQLKTLDDNNGSLDFDSANGAAVNMLPLPPSPAISATISPPHGHLEDSSDLTHGISQVICGNPVRALRTRCRTHPHTSTMNTPAGDDFLSTLSCQSLTSIRSSTHRPITVAVPTSRMLMVTPPPSRPHTTANIRHRQYRRVSSPSLTTANLQL